MRSSETEPWSVEEIEASLKRLCAELEEKPRTVYPPIRVAVTGSKVSPGLYESLALLGKDEDARAHSARSPVEPSPPNERVRGARSTSSSGRRAGSTSRRSGSSASQWRPTTRSGSTSTRNARLEGRSGRPSPTDSSRSRSASRCSPRCFLARAGWSSTTASTACGFPLRCLRADACAAASASSRSKRRRAGSA